MCTIPSFLENNIFTLILDGDDKRHEHCIGTYLERSRDNDVVFNVEFEPFVAASLSKQ